MRRYAWLLAVLAALALAGAGDARAENRALLIGVGVYANPSANLPGIDLDLNNMVQVIKAMGFTDAQIRIVKDNQATLAGMRQSIRDWLVQGLGPNDMGVFYYSGHGSQVPDLNGDEDDGLDEVLVCHDVEVDRPNKTLKNVLIDDEFGQLLNQIQAQNMLVFVDACHSGSATKALMGPDADGEMVKYYYYEGLTENLNEAATKSTKSVGGAPKSRGFSAEAAAPGGERYVALSAAQDNEKAIATKNGSLFTLALLQTVKTATQNNQSVTMDQLRLASTNYIQQAVSNPAKVHHPVLSGNQALATKAIALRGVDSGQPGGPGGPSPIWAELVKLANAANQKLQVTTNKPRYRVGEELIITCQVDRPGYLNVLNVGPGDQKPVVLFPNRVHPDNKVQAGQRITIPGPGDGFKLRAQPPQGPNLVVVFHTQENINAYRDGQGDAKDLFMTLSTKSTRGFAVEQERAGDYFAAGKFEAVIE